MLRIPLVALVASFGSLLASRGWGLSLWAPSSALWLLGWAGRLVWGWPHITTPNPLNQRPRHQPPTTTPPLQHVHASTRLRFLRLGVRLLLRRPRRRSRCRQPAAAGACLVVGRCAARQGGTRRRVERGHPRSHRRRHAHRVKLVRSHAQRGRGEARRAEPSHGAARRRPAPNDACAQGDPPPQRPTRPTRTLTADRLCVCVCVCVCACAPARAVLPCTARVL